MMSYAAPPTGAPPSWLALKLDRHFRYLVLSPAIAIILLVGLYPFIYSLVVSFMKINKRGTDLSFHGFVHYERLFGDGRFWDAVSHTIILTAIALPLELLFGLLLARLFLNHIPGRQVFISLVILPSVISPIVAGAMWRLMFDNVYGPINQVLGWIAGGPVDILWTLNSNPVVVYSAILICEVWQWTPFMFLLLLAAWSNVDRSQIEAAEIDGASGWRIFRRIVLPAIRPVVIVALTIRGLDLVKLFDIIWALTQGGPGTMTETISLYAYVLGFNDFNTSYTAAIAFVVILLLSAVVMGALRRVEIVR